MHFRPHRFDSSPAADAGFRVPLPLRAWIAAAAWLVVACGSAAAAGPELKSPAECRRSTSAWLERIAAGETASQALPSLWKDYGAIAYREEEIARFVASVDRVGEEVDAKLGPVIERRPEVIGALQYGPTTLHVLTSVRRARGPDLWRLSWSGRDGAWKLFSIGRGAEVAQFSSRFTEAVDPQDRIVSTFDEGVWEASPITASSELPADLQTFEHRRKTADQIAARLAGRDYAGAARAAASPGGAPAIGPVSLAAIAERLEKMESEEAERGAVLADSAEFLGSCRFGTDEETLLYSVRRKYADSWLACDFRRRDGVWTSTHQWLGDVAVSQVNLLARPLPGSPWPTPREKRPPSVPPEGPQPTGRSLEEAAWSRSAADSMQKFAAGDEAPLVRLMLRAAGDIPTESDCRARLETLKKADSEQHTGGGAYLGSLARYGRVRTGKDYFEEVFSREREHASGYWTVRIYRPTEVWRFAKIESGDAAAALSGVIVDRRPVWRKATAGSEAVEVRPLPRQFDPAGTLPDSLADLTDCRLAAHHLARTLSRREYATGMPAFIGRYARGSFQTHTEREKFAALLEQGVAAEKSLGPALTGKFEYLGRLHEGPSTVWFCYFLKHEGDVLPFALGFYRAEQEWICQYIHLGSSARRQCQWFAVVETE